jgi:hypothetical protein
MVLLRLHDCELDNRGSVPIRDLLVVTIAKPPLWLIQANVTEGFSTTVKRPKLEANGSPASGKEVKNKQYEYVICRHNFTSLVFLI